MKVTNEIFFRHTFICSECENYNYRVTRHSDPTMHIPHIDCGSCGKIFPIRHHATDVCFPPATDSELIAAAIIYAGLTQLGGLEEIDSFEVAISTVDELIESLRERKK